MITLRKTDPYKFTPNLRKKATAINTAEKQSFLNLHNTRNFAENIGFFLSGEKLISCWGGRGGGRGILCAGR